MSRYWSDLVNRLTPYVPGEQPQRDRLVKLNTNENPYPPSPKVLEALAAIGGDALRLYPDPDSMALRQSCARYNGLAPEQVFVGNGSDEVLAHVFQALLQHDLPLCFPDVNAAGGQQTGRGSRDRIGVRRGTRHSGLHARAGHGRRRQRVTTGPHFGFR